MEVKECHCLPVEHLTDQLKTHLEKGLTQQEAQARLQQHGPNELMEKPRPGFLSMLLAQFNNFLVIILIIAAVVSLLLGEIIDAIAIMVIVVLNAIVGVVQESKAEAALAALKKMAAPNAQVIRDGHQTTIPSRELVLGDIVLIEAGNYIPADMRLVESVNLKVEEASLTGESVPVDKNAAVTLDKEIPLGDRKNSAFMSTLVTYGRGKGHGHGDGHAHPDRHDCRDAPVLRGRSNPAAAEAGSTGQDPGDHLPDRLRDHLYLWPDPGYPSREHLRKRDSWTT